VAGSQELALDVVDGQVFLAQGDDQLAEAIPSGSTSGPGPRNLEEAVAFAGVMAELVAESPEGPWE